MFTRASSYFNRKLYWELNWLFTQPLFNTLVMEPLMLFMRLYWELNWLFTQPLFNTLVMEPLMLFMRLYWELNWLFTQPLFNTLVMEPLMLFMRLYWELNWLFTQPLFNTLVMEPLVLIMRLDNNYMFAYWDKGLSPKHRMTVQTSARCSVLPITTSLSFVPVECLQRLGRDWHWHGSWWLCIPYREPPGACISTC